MRLLSIKWKHKKFVKRAALLVLLFLYLWSPINALADSAPPIVPILSKVEPLIKDTSANTKSVGLNKTESANSELAPPLPTSQAIDSTQPSISKSGSNNVMTQSALIGTGNSTAANPSDKNIGVKPLNVSSDPGALEYTVPISLPPGRNGQTPDLTLSYSSKRTQDTGFGYGWSIGIPSITRYNKSGFNNLYSTSTPSTYFYSTLSGELASTSATKYVARNDDGSNVQYTFSGNIWTVIDKSGNTLIFGSTTASRQDDPSGSGMIYKWMLQKVTDTNGNSITYSYTKDLGQIYPSSITYTNTATTTGAFAVNFSMGLQATSTATSSVTGFPVKTRYQINQIIIQTSGSTTHSYSLSYGAGDNAARNLLKNVTETGQSLTGTLSLPATSFSYSTSTSAIATTTSAYGEPIQMISSNLDQGVVTVDVNGDGVLDTVQSFERRDSGGVPITGSIFRTVYIKTSYPGYSTTSPTYVPPCANDWVYFPSNMSLNNIQDGGGRIADVNGDGLADYICGTSTYINNGSNWIASSTWNTPVSMNILDGVGNSVDGGVRFADVNGDGLVDIIKGFSTSGTFTDTVYLNNGNGWATSSAWILPPHLDFTRDSGQDGGGRILDVNGDGLADIYLGLDDSYVSTSSVYINKGSGWSYDPTWILPDNIQVATTSGLEFADINNDGLADLSIANGYLSSGTDINSLVWTDNRIYLNTGSGWKRDFTRSVPFAYNITVNGVAYDTSPRWGNFNGSGLNTLTLDFEAGGANYAGDYSTQGTTPDLLKGITDSSGKSTLVTYKSTSSYTAPVNSYANPNLPYYFPVVSRIDTGDGISATSTEQYTYSGGTFYFGGPLDRQFSGFSTIDYNDGAGNHTFTYYHTGKGNATSSGENADNQSKIGMVYRIESYDGLSNLYKKVINKWESFVRSGIADFVFNTRTTELDYDGLATHKDSSQEMVYSTSTGALSQTTSWGQVNAANDGTFTDVGTDKITTNLSYAASTTIPISKLARSTVTDQSGNTLSDIKYLYDNLPLGSLTKGNLTEEDDLKTAPSTYIQKIRNTYNSYGLLLQQFDARGATTTYSYDSLNLYPSTITNALGHVTTNLYNYAIGSISQTTDPNGAIIKTLFDPIDRVTAILQPDPLSTTTLATTTSYTYTDIGMPRLVHEFNYLDNSNIINKYTYKDGYGRIIETRTQAEGSNYKVSDTKYNSRGLIYTQSLPFFGSGTAYTGTSSPASATLLTTYLYDPLKRILQQSTYINYRSYAYGNWVYTVTDELGKKKDYYSDAYNNLTNVVEYSSGVSATTTYAYDGTGNLSKITDALGNVRNYTYDLLGRVLKNEDLHATGDTTFGSTTYAYDDNGNITQTISALGKIVNYTYDALNRVKTEDTPDTAYTDVLYVYDNSLHAGLGHLGTVSTPYIATGYDYDWNGNLLAERHLIPGSATTTTWFYYDRQHNPTYIYYPDNSEVYYGYNSAGLLELVYQIESGAGAWTVLVSNFDYSPMDQVTQTQYGNGTASMNTYNATNLYWLGTRVAYNSQYFQYQTYGHDNEGHITSVQESAGINSGKLVNYTYDDLYRLTIASSSLATNGQNFRQTFSYDAIGNLTNNSGINYLYQGNTGINYANPHAVTAIGSNPNSYDQSGDLLSTASSTNVWDYKNRLTQTITTVGTTTATTTYTYDQVGNRITKTVGSLTTYYPNKYYTNTSTGLVDKYVFANGQLLTTIENIGTSTNRYWSYADPLKSTNITANSSGGVIQVLDYYPYGAPRINQTSTAFDQQRKYIGEYYDSSDALSYLNARYYDPNRSQFISEDPVFWGNPKDQDLMNPQDLNSYSYSINNPVTYSDPTGQAAEDVAIEGLEIAAPLIDAGAQRVITTALELFGKSMAVIDAANVYISTKYSNGVSSDDKYAAWNALALDVLTNGAGRGLDKAGKLSLDSGTALLSVLGTITGRDYTPKLINSPLISSGKSISGGASVNKTSNSSTSATNNSSSSKTNSRNNASSNSSSRNNSGNNTSVIVTSTTKTTISISGNKITITKTTTTTVTVTRKK